MTVQHMPAERKRSRRQHHHRHRQAAAVMMIKACRNKIFLCAPDSTSNLQSTNRVCSIHLRRGDSCFCAARMWRCLACSGIPPCIFCSLSVEQNAAWRRCAFIGVIMMLNLSTKYLQATTLAAALALTACGGGGRLRQK